MSQPFQCSYVAWFCLSEEKLQRNADYFHVVSVVHPHSHLKRFILWTEPILCSIFRCSIMNIAMVKDDDDKLAAQDLASVYRRSYPGMEILIIKIRRSCDRLIFIMSIPILVIRHLYIARPPRAPVLLKTLHWNLPFNHFYDGMGFLCARTLYLKLKYVKQICVLNMC